MTRKGANPFNCGDSRSLYVWPRLPLFSSVQSNQTIATTWKIRDGEAILVQLLLQARNRLTAKIAGPLIDARKLVGRVSTDRQPLYGLRFRFKLATVNELEL